MKKIILMLLVLMMIMPLANAAVTIDLWPYGSTVEEVEEAGYVVVEQSEPGLYSIYPTTQPAPTGMFKTLAAVAPLLTDWKPSGDATYECQKAADTLTKALGVPVEPCGSSFKFDKWGEPDIPLGSYSVPGNTISISNSDAYTFSWTSTYPVCIVVVKAGTSANVYYYPKGSLGDTELVAPYDKEISHVAFCYSGGTQEIPEFPTVALPIAAILGLAFIFMRRK